MHPSHRHDEQSERILQLLLAVERAPALLVGIRRERSPDIERCPKLCEVGIRLQRLQVVVIEIDIR